VAVKVGAEFEVEVAEKWEVVIKVGWEFEMEVVEKWEVVVMSTRLLSSSKSLKSLNNITNR
jgi:hypothetical protein